MTTSTTRSNQLARLVQDMTKCYFVQIMNERFFIQQMADNYYANKDRRRVDKIAAYNRAQIKNYSNALFKYTHAKSNGITLVSQDW